MYPAFLSLLSFILVWVVIKEEPKKDKKKKKLKTGQLPVPGAVEDKGPPVLAFTFLGLALTAPAYMVTGEFFTILAVKLEVQVDAWSGSAKDKIEGAGGSIAQP